MVYAFSQSMWHFWYEALVTLPSLSPYSNKVLISGAHRWETANTYLQDISCIVNKSNQDVHVWRMNSVWWWWWKQWWKSNSTFALLRGYIPFLHFEAFEQNEILYIFFFFSLRWVSCTPNSTVRHLSIFTSRLTFSFLWGFGHLPFFIPSYIFFRALTLLE